MSLSSKKKWRENPRNRRMDMLHAQAWKDRQRRPCTQCGALMSYDNRGNLCTRCHNRAQRYWTPERVVEAIHRFYAENGRRPGAADFSVGAKRGTDGYPSLTATYGKNGAFATWSDALVAAGFDRPRDGHYIDESKRGRRS